MLLKFHFINCISKNRYKTQKIVGFIDLVFFLPVTNEIRIKRGKERGGTGVFEEVSKDPPRITQLQMPHLQQGYEGSFSFVTFNFLRIFFGSISNGA